MAINEAKRAHVSSEEKLHVHSSCSFFIVLRVLDSRIKEKIDVVMSLLNSLLFNNKA